MYVGDSKCKAKPEGQSQTVCFSPEKYPVKKELDFLSTIYEDADISV